jgi:hypothetical protein
MLLVNGDLQILFLSDTVEGKRHDKAIADSTPYPLPPGSALMQDLGLLGFGLEGVRTVMPVKKPRGAELSAEQKAFNRRVSQRRVRIEHVNGSVKRCRIVKEVIRLLKDGVRDLVMELCCALHNFRARLTPWQKMT